MAATYNSVGENITLTATADVTVDTPVLFGAMFVIPTVSVLSGEDFVAATCGVWEIAKASANTPAQLAKAYWDDTAKEVTTTATANTLIGVFAEAYVNGDTVAKVRLNGVSV